MEGETCAWCDGKGEKYPEYSFGGTCGWCDGTGIQKPSFHGHDGECEHRSCGPIRAWCYDCGEWCYASGPEDGCRGCRQMQAQEEVAIGAAIDIVDNNLGRLAVANPDYASRACEQLRRISRRVEKYLAARAEADLPGQTTLPLTSLTSSEETSERSGETTPPAQG